MAGIKKLLYMLGRQQAWSSPAKVDRIGLTFLCAGMDGGVHFAENGFRIPVCCRALERHADEVAVIAFGLAEWDVNVNPESHNKLSVSSVLIKSKTCFRGEEALKRGRS